MFGKKKATPNTAQSQPDTAGWEGRVRAMPERFYVAPKTRRWGPIIFSVLGIAGLGGLAAYAVYLTINLQQERNAPLPAPTNVPPVEVVHQPGAEATPPEPAPTPTPNVPVPNPTTPVVATGTAATTTGGIFNIPTTPPSEPAPSEPEVGGPLPSAPDGDTDGLTAAEEALYGVNPAVADTDGDSYSDGSEVLNGYDPSRARVTLEDSGQFAVYVGPMFRIAYPSVWTRQPIGASGDEVLFRSGGQEFVSVVVLDKPATQTVRDWFAEQSPSENVGAATIVQLGTLEGLRSADLQQYYLTDAAAPGRVYVVSYSSGNATELNYLATFVAMVKSFRGGAQ